MIRKYFWVIHIIIKKIIIGNTQPAHDVPGTSSEGLLKVLIFATYRGPSGDSQGTNTKISDFMKKIFFRIISPCITYLFLFLQEEQIFKSFKWGTSTGPSCGTSLGPNDEPFQGRPWDVGQTYVLNSTHKYIKLALTGYSSKLTLKGYSTLYSEWQQRKIQ